MDDMARPHRTTGLAIVNAPGWSRAIRPEQAAMIRIGIGVAPQDTSGRLPPQAGWWQRFTLWEEDPGVGRISGMSSAAGRGSSPRRYWGVIGQGVVARVISIVPASQSSLPGCCDHFERSPPDSRVWRRVAGRWRPQLFLH